MPPFAARAVPFLALLVAAAAFVPGSAGADCVEAGANLTCTNDDTDGIVAVGNTLTVDVQAGATVDNNALPNVNALELLNDNTVTTDATSSITTTGDDADGINMTNDNTVTHAGTIRVGDPTLVNTGSVGIAGGTGNMVTNDGIVAAFGDASRGIELGDGGSVTNNGSVSAQGVGSIGVNVGSGHQVDNAGSVTGIGANAIAVQLGAGSDLDNDFSIGASGDGSRGVVVTGGMDTTIDNAIGALISSESAADDDIAIDYSGTTGGTHTLTNAGTIRSDFQAILGGPGSEMIVNQGGLVGDIDLGAGDDVLELNATGFTSGLLDGGANTDALRLRGSGSGVLDLNQVMGFESLDIDDDGLWDVSGSAGFGGGVALRGDTTLRVQNTTEFSAGDFLAEAGTTLVVVVDPGVSNGRLSLTGGATTADLSANPELAVLALAPLQTGTLTVLDAPNIVGGFGTTPADTLLVDYTLLPMATRIDLQIVRNSYASLARTPNQRAAASHLDAILAAGPSDPGILDALRSLELLSAQGLASAFDQLHAEPFDFHTGQSAALGRQFAEIATAPRPWCKPSLYGLRPVPRPEVPCGPRGWSAWMQALAGFGDRDAGGTGRRP